MSDVQSSPTVPIPNFMLALARAFAQKALTAVAMALTGYGFLPSSDQQQFVTWALAAVLWGVSCLWTYLVERRGVIKVKAAINAPAANPPIPLKP